MRTVSVPFFCIFFARQVETIGDAYMVVGGAPVICDQHAQRVCDMAFDMLAAIQDLTDPSTGSPVKPSKTQ